MNKKYIQTFYVCIAYFTIRFILVELPDDQKWNYYDTYQIPMILLKLLDIAYSLGAAFFLFNDNYKIRNSGIGLGLLISLIFIKSAMGSGYKLLSGLKALRGDPYPLSIPLINAALDHIAIPVIALLFGWFAYKKKKWELSATFLLIGLVYVMVALILSSVKFLFIKDNIQQ